MIDLRSDDSRLLQYEYTANIEQAYNNKALNNGQYTKEGVRLLLKAAAAQRALAERTEGATRASHRQEFERLSQLVQRESVRLGIIPEKKPDPEPVSAASVKERGGKASAPKAPTAGAKKDEISKEEVGESFNLEDFILKAQELTLDDVSLPSDVIQLLKDALDPFDPIAMYPEATKGWKHSPRTNFLFFGPPGTGKSHLCSALNGTMQQNYPGKSIFFLVEGNQLISKWRGSTGHRLHALFSEAEKYDFAIICIDEFEQLCPDRRKVEDRESYTKNFLTLMEGVGGRTSAMVVACTNHPQLLDPAILSRLENRVFIDYPGVEDIVRFFTCKKQYVDCLGQTPEEAEAVARALAEDAARRHFSYRNLNVAVSRMSSRVIAQNRKAYPQGSATLKHLVPLTREEALEVLSGIDSDFNAEQYGIYKDYLEKKEEG